MPTRVRRHIVIPVLSNAVSQLARIRVTIGYAAALSGTAALLVLLGPQTQDRIIRAASTNLDNLRHGRLETLLGSAFVADAGPIYLWLPGLFCLLALAELLWRSGRLAMVFVTGHVGATLLVAAGLAAAVRFGWLPWSVGSARDVGMSYGAAAVLGALTAAIPACWRPAWIGWWISVALGTAMVCVEFTDIGHVTALLLGMLLGVRFGGPVRWTPVRTLLLAVSGVFGFVVLAHTALSIPVCAGLGLVGAVAADRAVRYRLVRRAAAARGAVAAEPVRVG